MRHRLDLFWPSLSLCGGLLFTPACSPLQLDPGPGGTHATVDDTERGALTAPTAVDVLLVIDNSGSMAQEQRKFAAVLDKLVTVLSSGHLEDSPEANALRDFPPVQSLHIGVVSTDMGVNGAQPQKSCGALSFRPDERDPQTATEFLIKPFGDDGVLRTSTAVAQTGIWVSPWPGGQPEEIVPGDPSCADVQLSDDQRFIDYTAGESDVGEIAHAFGCLAKLGKNGCGLEQQLEASLKALTPHSSHLRFSENTPGQGGHTGPNAGFLREDAILVVVFVSDEDDCSIPDSSREMFDATSTAIAGQINVRCGLEENQSRLHPLQRYVDGLRALKPVAYQDRILVTSLVGVPLDTDRPVHTGATSIQELLDRDDMQFRVELNQVGTADQPVATCSGTDGDAAPGRRFLELSKAFGDNGMVSSICASDYSAVIGALIEKIGTGLRGGEVVLD